MNLKILFFFLLVLPKITFGQHFFRIEGDITVKGKNETEAQLTIGKFYYDKNIGKLVYYITFPEKQVVVSKDTVLYHIVADTIKSRTRTIDMTKFSIFHLTLSNQLNNFGLENTFYKIENVETEGDMVISTWIPDKNRSKFFGKVMLSTKENQLYGIVFFDAEDKIVGKQFFENYKLVEGLEFPQRMVKINYYEDQKSYQVTTFENIKLNNVNEKYYYNYPIPGN